MYLRKQYKLFYKWIDHQLLRFCAMQKFLENRLFSTVKYVHTYKTRWKALVKPGIKKYYIWRTSSIVLKQFVTRLRCYFCVFHAPITSTILNSHT